MTEHPAKFAHGDYTVGWICALPETELVAAMAMLDERHPALPAIDPHDANSYVLGRIGDHNVVIACLPAATTGKVSAATVAKDMIRSFQAVRFGLMVGIGGGAPYYGARGNDNSASGDEEGEDSEDSEDDPEDIRDIRLGDVVISLHSKSSDAVVQYDFGKSLQKKEFIRSGGKLNKPPNIVLSAVSQLQAEHRLNGQNQIREILSKSISNYPANATDFQYPVSRKDRLFKSTIVHGEGKKSCKSCCGPQNSNLVKRKDRPDNSPQLHYGTIGSADQVMKDAVLRDKWAWEESIICFEMEAAGLMDSFPCLVIRGICDYADSHKNKAWQLYAAATAASCAKELLLVISGQGVMRMDPIKQIEESIREINDVVKDTSAAIQDLRDDQVFAKLPYAEGSSFDASDAEYDTCHPETRINLLHHIKEWAWNPKQKCIFWLNGMAGTGKSTISRTIAQYSKKKGRLGASFFFKREERDRSTAKKFFTTICAQLLLHIPALIRHVKMAIDEDPYIAGKLMKEQFEKLLLQPLLNLNQNEPTVVVIVIDALDECENKDDIRTILHLLPQVQKCKSIHLRIFFTSRPELPIRSVLEENDYHQELVLHELSQTVIEKDIRIFLKAKFLEIKNTRKISGEWPGDDALETLVMRAVPLFISAATICRFVGDQKWRPESRILTILQDPAATSGSQMDRTYLPVLNQLFSGANDREVKQLKQEFQDIVGIIILLATPLSVDALAELINLPVIDISNRLDGFHSVLSVPENINSPIRILHLSFRDYLLITDSSFRVDEKETHGKIASHCLRVMDASLKQNICGLASYGIQRIDIDSQVINQHLSAELEYSCHHWVYHLKQSKGCISESEVLSFLKQHFLHWLEALSLFGIISEAVGIIDTLESGIWSSTGAEFSDFLKDTRRFTLKNAYIASIAPLQLYCSGLVFSPMQSTIRKHFSNRIPKQFRILPQVENLWSPALQTLEGHSKQVASVAFSPDGQSLASGGEDGTIKLWDTKTGSELQTIEIYLGSVNSIAFSPDGQSLASGSGYGTIKLWDAKTGSELQTFEEQTVKDYTVWINSVAFSLDGQILVSGSSEGTIKLWDAKTGSELQTINDPVGVLSVAVSLDRQTLASCSWDSTIKLWDIQTGSELQTLEDHSDGIRSVVFSPDGQTLASGSKDSTIKLWDFKTGSILQTFKGHLGPVRSVVFSSDGQTLASGSDDHIIKLWDVKTGSILQTLEGHSYGIRSVVFSPDGQTLASGSSDSTIKLWDIQAGSGLQTSNGHSGSVDLVVFSPDGQTLASGGEDGTIKLWDAKTSSELQTLKGHSDEVLSITFSLDGQTLASGSRDSTIKLWDSKTGSVLQTLKGHSGSVLSMAFSPDGQTLATGSNDNTIKLWDTKTGSELQTLKSYSGSVHSIVFSPDGQSLASGSDNGTIKLWDAKTGSGLQTLKGYLGSINSVTFSPNGQTLASGSYQNLPPRTYDGIIMLWDAKTGSVLQILKGHSDQVLLVVFSPDGQSLVSGSNDGTIKLWDARTGSELQTLEGHSGSVRSVAFNLHAEEHTATRSASIPQLHDNYDPTSYNINHQILLSNSWVVLGGENLLWLPSEHREFTTAAVEETTIALGYSDGRVSIMGFHTL